MTITIGCSFCQNANRLCFAIILPISASHTPLVPDTQLSIRSTANLSIFLGPLCLKHPL